VSLSIRIRGLGRYVGPRLEMDGVSRPQETFRSLLRIAGIELQASDEDPQVTFAVPGHVLRDISLDIERGSVVLLTGSSGKAELLQILAGVMPPTSGRVELYDPVTALLSTGDNLDPLLTAHENIKASPAWVSASSPEDAERYMADVLDFSELRAFEHAPIRTYSTGMVLRLSVALALCGSPSLVLIDDVLAVGDIGFQQRCTERVQALKDAGCTLLLALPDEAHVRQLATRVITLSDGRIVGDTSPMEKAAPSLVSRAAEIEWRVSENLAENDVMALRAVVCQAEHDDQGSFLDIGATFEPRVDALRCRPLISVETTRSELFRSIYPSFVAVEGQGTLTFTVRVPISMLPDGDYSIGVHMAALRDPHVYALKVSDAVHVTVRRHHAPETRDVVADSVQPLLMLPTQWEVEPVVEASA
jgi:ABC-type polysaccharide/polyol phosphate transport system ATPase subunit